MGDMMWLLAKAHICWPSETPPFQSPNIDKKSYSLSVGKRALIAFQACSATLAVGAVLIEVPGAPTKTMNLSPMLIKVGKLVR